jgi:hypothetical protein
MSSNQLPSADVLRTSLTALSLPVWGSREQMWERIKNGGGKNKPGPKPGKKNKDMSGGTFSVTNPLLEPGELKFYNAERPKLLALGISDHIKLTTELKRRWEESKASKTTSTSTKTKGSRGQTFMSDTVISAVDMASAGLKLIGVDSSSGCNKYIYEIVSKTTSTGGGAASSVTKKKRKKEEYSDDDSGDDSDDSEMDRCEDIVAQRFRKWPKSVLKERLKAYKDKTTGTKKELAERLAENVTNDTSAQSNGASLLVNIWIRVVVCRLVRVVGGTNA